jgi:predicted O-linked N-acetylglucosamine transferase (SPINDLY family)
MGLLEKPGSGEDLIRQAIDYQQQGMDSRAEEVCRRILAQHCRHAEALHTLGIVLYRNGRTSESLTCLESAARQRPSVATFHNSLGVVRWWAGDLEAALSSFHKAVGLVPHDVGFLLHRALALQAAGRYREAVEAFRAVLQRDSGSVVAHCGLGETLFSLGRFSRSATSLRRAIRYGPERARLRVTLASVEAAQGRYDEAITELQKAISLDRRLFKAHATLGSVFHTLGRYRDAMRSYLDSLRLRPDAVVFNNLAACYLRQGHYRKAVRYFREAARVDPDFSAARSNLLFSLNYDASRSPSNVFSEHTSWASRHADRLGGASAIRRGSFPERRIRVGYVSAEFDRHPTAFFFEPILASQSTDRFETYCYSNVSKPDAVTERLRSLARRWRNISELSDNDTALRIRKDRIDILVDLSGHLGGNRLLVFARRPAPIQITYLGYPNTTGLAAMDYRITDEWADPVGLTEHLHTEKLIRLPAGFLCYQPPSEAPQVGELPAHWDTVFTFGSFNIRPKITATVIATWAAILSAAPKTRLLIKSFETADREVRSDLIRRFRGNGIPATRLRFVDPTRSHAEHLDAYNQVDLVLDTFPYNGTTTTCDALWMGAPVLTLKGTTHVSRVGYSLLSNTGLSEFVADSVNDYVERAARLARDLGRLAAVRSSLRDRMLSSPLLDRAGFTRSLEDAYREVWRRWCSSNARTPHSLRAEHPPWHEDDHAAKPRSCVDRFVPEIR